MLFRFVNFFVEIHDSAYCHISLTTGSKRPGAQASYITQALGHLESKQFYTKLSAAKMFKISFITNFCNGFIYYLAKESFTSLSI
jgi:hypothetical protein